MSEPSWLSEPGGMSERELARLMDDPPYLEPPPIMLLKWHTALDELPVPGRPPAIPAPRADARGRGELPGSGGSERLGGQWRGLTQWRPGPVVGSGLAMGAAVAALVLGMPSLSPSPPVAGHPPLTLRHTGPAPTELAELADPARRAACLAHLGAPGGQPVDTRSVDWHGQPAVRLVLGTSERGHYRVVVVTPDCAANSGRVLDDRTN